MKSVVLLALAAVAFAQHIDVPFEPTPSRLGYDNQAKDVAKDKGYMHGSWPVVWPASNGTRLFVRVSYETTSLTTNSATFTLICSETSTAPRALADGDIVITKTAGQAQGDGQFEVRNKATTVVYCGAEVTCSGCSKSGDFKLSAILEYGSAPTSVVKQPFDMIDNSFTWDYYVPVNTWGVAAKVTVPLPNNGGDKLFAAMDVQGTQQASVQLVYNLGQPYAPEGSQVALPAPSTTTRIVPSSSRKGDFRTGALTLTAGVWYVSPYVADAGAVAGTPAHFDIAYGFGHEPSSAGMMMPSVVVTALLALFAYLFA
jgi:hypothetical protein